MLKRKIVIKGNKEGLNVLINMLEFDNFDQMVSNLKNKLERGKRFYKGSVIKITTQLKYIDSLKRMKLKNILFDEFLIKDCIFEDIERKENKTFHGIHEGRTKFIKKTIRSGQIVNFQGNVVIIGDVSSGAEVQAAGNVIVLGVLKGNVYAGNTGNKHAIIAAYVLQPQILRIANIMTRSPDDEIRPSYPEVAKIKDKSIIVEPYLPNKFI